MDRLSLRLTGMRYEAQGVHSLEFRAPEGGLLPAFTAGAHIDLHLRNGITRSYSLCNPTEPAERYVVCVNRDRASRGGSSFVHDTLRVGDLVAISPPRNNFELDEAAQNSILIGGGIGMTPLWAMVQRLEQLGKRWELHYCARSAQTAAFLGPIRDLSDRTQVGVLHLHFDDQTPGEFIDLNAIVSGAAPGTHFYCCGPGAMLDAFSAVTAALPPAQVHLEFFSARSPVANEGGFTVELAASRRAFVVPPGKSILDVLIEAGVEVPYSCMEGVCGTCETRVVDGIPDHRDLVLTPQEIESNRTMMICCSGSKTPKLVLDL
jgi:vanillate O-demethylase ferredoxin subunit